MQPHKAEVARDGRRTKTALCFDRVLPRVVQREPEQPQLNLKLDEPLGALPLLRDGALQLHRL